MDIRSASNSLNPDSSELSRLEVAPEVIVDGRRSPDLLRYTKRRDLKIPPVCKTCIRCRARKAKCDGARPRCSTCTTRSTHPYGTCIYPEDGRLAAKPTRAEIDALQSELALVRDILNLQNNPPPPGQLLSNGGRAQVQELVRNSGADHVLSLSQAPLPRTPMHPRNDDILSALPQPKGGETATIESSQIDVGAGQAQDNADIVSPYIEDGSLQVPGLTSYLYQFPAGKRSRSCTSENEQKAQLEAIKDQLFANTAYQRQRESFFWGSPARPFGPQVDFDGVPPELAIHLLNIHWNRQQFAYLLTYRPAIFDSLANNGPYANKLLLNAIFYSSCGLVRSGGTDPEVTGETFYKRFKMLLMDEIDKASLPTIVALIVVGRTLVSDGKQDAGWNLCGTAYRMIISLGLHLTATSPPNTKTTAIEMEMRTRIYWGAFMLDKHQSLYIGRPPMLRPEDARVSKTMLDRYEELENWAPYIGPREEMTPKNTLLAAYQPRPIFTISTFQLSITLSEIAYAITTKFYTVGSVNTPHEQLLKAKHEIQCALNSWRERIPHHLRYDPAVDPTPPPTQITPHAFYHTLLILLDRPFLSNGHLSSCSGPQSQSHGEVRCTDAAFQIWHLLDAYQKAFTFMRTPYLMCYAAYCATVVIINHANIGGSEYVKCLRFFWFALLEIHKNCHFGLKKPLKILQELMQRMGKCVPNWNYRETQPVGDEALDTTQSQGFEACGIADAPRHDDLTQLDFWLHQNLEIDGGDVEGWGNAQLSDQWLIDDSLFGLMNPSQPAI